MARASTRVGEAHVGFREGKGGLLTTNAEWVERLRNTMPYGSSTCSKASKWPEEPGVIVRGDGCRVWDADGNEYIDFRNSLGPVTLGYRFPAVDEAIRKQLENGIIFGYPHPLECEVSELICDTIDSAEQARFLKTGGESCAACLRLARAYTGRDYVIQIGYNGWINSVSMRGSVLPNQEAGGEPPPGVPAALSRLHLTGKWDDIDGVRALFEEHPGQVACVMIAAAYDTMERGRDFYPALRKLTEEHGALLMHDEIVTGFRVAIGGVQEHFGVRPDLSVFAKGIANGMPLSVYCGRRDVMETASKAVVSSTYGGETLTLAAAKAAITTYRDEDVIGHLWRTGEKLWGGLNAMLAENGLDLAFGGLWPCARLGAGPDAREGLLTDFMRAGFRNGVCLYNCGYVNYSHKEKDVAETLERLEKAVKETAAG